MELLTIAQIAKQLGLPESTVRYYRDRFSEYIPTTGEGRGRRYRGEAVEVFRVIADKLRAGMPADPASLLRMQPAGQVRPCDDATMDSMRRTCAPCLSHFVSISAPRSATSGAVRPVVTRGCPGRSPGRADRLLCR